MPYCKCWQKKILSYESKYIYGQAKSKKKKCMSLICIKRSDKTGSVGKKGYVTGVLLLVLTRTPTA